MDGCGTIASDDSPRTAEDIYCGAYIEALNASMQAACQWPNNETAPAIGYLPSSAAGARAFLLWVDKHPETLGQPFSHGMMSALQEAFPCLR